MMRCRYKTPASVFRRGHNDQVQGGTSTRRADTKTPHVTERTHVGVQGQSTKRVPAKYIVSKISRFICNASGLRTQEYICTDTTNTLHTLNRLSSEIRILECNNVAKVTIEITDLSHPIRSFKNASANP